MFSLKNRSKGFTIVELLIVIVVIAILATLVIVTFTGIQEKARDSQRQTDINALDSHIEAYYAQTGTYPTLAMINDDDWVANAHEGPRQRSSHRSEGWRFASNNRCNALWLLGNPR